MVFRRNSLRVYRTYDNFEKDLFEAATRMRATVASADYKHIVLPLIFLRYLSIRYDNRRKQLEADMEDTELREELLIDRDQYIAERVYVLGYCINKVGEFVTLMEANLCQSLDNIILN